MKFDVSHISKEVAEQIVSAKLRLYFTEGKESGMSYYVHRVQKEWKENEITWEQYQIGKTWDSAGCDFDTARITTTYRLPDNEGWEEYTVTDIIKDFIKGTYPNYGLIIFPSIGRWGAPHRFYFSSEYSVDPLKRPKIEIEFDQVNTVPGGNKTITDNKAIVLKKLESQVSLEFERGRFHTLSVIDAKGSNVFSTAIDSRNSLLLPSDRFSAGVYFVNMRGRSDNRVIRFVLAER